MSRFLKGYKSNLPLKRKLRKEMTPAEIKIWSKLKGKQLLNLRFRKQHGIGPYIVDFYCAEKGIVIEVDGDIHVIDKSHIQKDKEREHYLKYLGLKVIRYTNNEILRNLEEVMENIYRQLLSHSTSPNPSLQRRGSHLFLWIASSLTLLAMTSNVHAGDTGLQGFDRQIFKPAADQSGIYNVVGTEIPPQFKIRTGFITNFGKDPITVVVPATGRRVEILDWFWGGDFLVSTGYWNHWSLGLALPVLFYGNGTNFNSLQSYKAAAFGDLRLDLKYRVVKESKKFPAIAFFSVFGLPTGSRRKFAGERGVTWEYRVVGEKTFRVQSSEFKVLGNVGFKIRKEVQVLASNYGDTFTFGVGGRYTLPWQQKSWAIESELIGESYFTNTRDSGVPLELRLGGRKKLDEKKNVYFGVGRGLTNAIGSPDFRMFGGVEWNF